MLAEDFEWESEVVPHVGTWIEIRRVPEERYDDDVVPHVGTWIEIKSGVL